MRLLRHNRGTRPPTAASRSAFTLAEIAVTLVIVAIALLLVMEGLSSSKLTAAQSNYRKIALALGRETIGRVEAGLFWEDLDGVSGTFNGSYAEEGYPAFTWELIIGDEEFAEYEDDEESAYFDNFAHRRYQEQEFESENDQEEEQAYADTGTTGGPFERVTVRVLFPQLTDQPNELLVERWIPLEQVFGRSPDQIEADEDAADDQSSNSGGSSR